MYRNDISDLEPLSDMKFENIFNMSKTEDNGYYFYNITRTVRFDASELDDEYYFKYVVDRQLSWPALSFRYYNTIDLWWLICVINGIDNPVEFTKPGRELKLIKKSHVNTVVSAIKSQLQ